MKKWIAKNKVEILIWALLATMFGVCAWLHLRPDPMF